MWARVDFPALGNPVNQKARAGCPFRRSRSGRRILPSQKKRIARFHVLSVGWVCGVTWHQSPASGIGIRHRCRAPASVSTLPAHVPVAVNVCLETHAACVVVTHRPAVLHGALHQTAGLHRRLHASRSCTARNTSNRDDACNAAKAFREDGSRQRLLFSGCEPVDTPNR